MVLIMNYLSFNGAFAPLIPGDINVYSMKSDVASSAPAIIQLAAPVNPEDAANKAYVDSHITAPAGPTDSVQYNNGGVLGGSSNFTYTSSTSTLEVPTIDGLLPPSGPQNAVNKMYVDQATWKTAVNGASTVSIALGLQISSIDGVLTTNGYRFLIKDQANPSENGIYTCNNMYLTRSADANTSIQASGINVYVIGGSVNKGITYECASYSNTNYGPLLFGSAITFNVVSVEPAGSSSQIQFNSNGVFGADSNLTWTAASGTSPGYLTTGKITGLTYVPVNASDATNKAYVDAQIGSNPGGSNYSVQYNKNGLFWGDTTLAWDYNTSTLSVAGTITDGIVTINQGNIIGLNTLNVDNINSSGILTIYNTSPSTGPSTGALIVLGGLGIKGTVNVAANVFADGLYATSDASQKSDICVLDPVDSLDILKRVECCSYIFKNERSRSYGVIAQQLEQIGLSNIVNKNNSLKAVNYIQLIALLINAVQELDRKLETKLETSTATSTHTPIKIKIKTGIKTADAKMPVKIKNKIKRI